MAFALLACASEMHWKYASPEFCHWNRGSGSPTRWQEITSLCKGKNDKIYGPKQSSEGYQAGRGGLQGLLRSNTGGKYWRGVIICYFYECVVIIQSDEDSQEEKQTVRAFTSVPSFSERQFVSVVKTFFSDHGVHFTQ